MTHRWCGKKEGRLLDCKFCLWGQYHCIIITLFWTTDSPSISLSDPSCSGLLKLSLYSDFYILVTSHLCNPRSSNGNKLIKIKYEHVIAFLAMLVSYELQYLDQVLSWLFTGSRRTDDIKSNIRPSGGKPLTSPWFWGFWVLNNFVLPGWISTKNFMPHCHPKIEFIASWNCSYILLRIGFQLLSYFWIYLLSLGERGWFFIKRWCVIF